MKIKYMLLWCVCIFVGCNGGLGSKKINNTAADSPAAIPGAKKKLPITLSVDEYQCIEEFIHIHGKLEKSNATSIFQFRDQNGNTHQFVLYKYGSRLPEIFVNGNVSNRTDSPSFFHYEILGGVVQTQSDDDITQNNVVAIEYGIRELTQKAYTAKCGKD